MNSYWSRFSTTSGNERFFCLESYLVYMLSRRAAPVWVNRWGRKLYLSPAEQQTSLLHRVETHCLQRASTHPFCPLRRIGSAITSSLVMDGSSQILLLFSWPSVDPYIGRAAGRLLRLCASAPWGCLFLGYPRQRFRSDRRFGLNFSSVARRSVVRPFAPLS